MPVADTHPVLKLRSPRRPSTFSSWTCLSPAAHTHAWMGMSRPTECVLQLGVVRSLASAYGPNLIGLGQGCPLSSQDQTRTKETPLPNEPKPEILARSQDKAGQTLTFTPLGSGLGSFFTEWSRPGATSSVSRPYAASIPPCIPLILPDPLSSSLLIAEGLIAL